MYSNNHSWRAFNPSKSIVPKDSFTMVTIQKHSIATLQTALFTLLLLCASACGKGDSETAPQFNEADWKISSTVNYAEGFSAIILTGTPNVDWKANITEGNDWCSFSSKDFTHATTKTGTVTEGLNVLYVYYKTNAGREQRQAALTIQFAEKEAQYFDLIQLSQSQQNLPAFSSWAELPESKESVNYQYVTHYAQLSNKRARNYSLCFDKTKKAALWVAYPIHAAYLGSSGRTDAWAFDPIVPFSFQPDCTNRSYRGNYDRGHQLPSGDRQATNELNAQTFYMSNLTPQLDRLNQDMWAQLESQVRRNNCSDTLYVVTGAYFGAGAGTTTDGVGNTVPIPTNYYKVLLRTKSGSSGKAIKDCSDSELISIGFWVEQRSYGNIAPPRSICTTVVDIESKTGFKFFPQVSNAVKQQNAPNQWGIN